MNDNNKNATNGFETIPALAHGMSFFPQKGLISRVEQNCSRKRLSTGKQWIKEKEEDKHVSTIEGFGDMPFATLCIIFSSRKEGSLVRLNDARNNKLTSAEEICKINPNLVKEYHVSKQNDISGTNNQEDIFCYDSTDNEELYDDVQQVPEEIFGYDRIVFGYGLNKKSKPAGLIIWSYPVSVAITKLYIMQHYPSDMAGGFLLGLIISIIRSNLMKLDQQI